MNRHILAWAASAAVLGVAGAAPAMAADPPATQALGQTASNQQSASSDAASTQDNPTNQNISVRVLSPGNNGPVTQTNASQALAAAGNANSTSQSATQAQGGGGGTQAVGQDAASKQTADADAASTQVKPSNQNIDVRVLSPGHNGPVSQTNASQAGALAGNKNSTSQNAAQTQGGGGGTQAVGQDADNKQNASADAHSKQVEPSNQNIGVRVLSPGDNGSVSQTNASEAGALAANHNDTTQDAKQSQGGSAPVPVRECKLDCGHGSSTGIQAVGQSAANKQDASADATSEQIHPSNVNAPVRVGSPGNDGSVDQANVSSAEALAANANGTTQSADQQQGGGGSGPAIQAAGQQASSDQKADADAESKQIGASNTNAPVRVLSAGGGGSVEQLNASGAIALAGNENATAQGARQVQGGMRGGPAIQALGQDAGNRQHADADAESEQICPVNLNAPVWDGAQGHKDDRKAGKDEEHPMDGKDEEHPMDGKDGKDDAVMQANLSWAKSMAANKNRLMQWGGQVQ